MDAQYAEGKRVNAAEILGDAFKFYGRHAAVVVGASALIQFTTVVLTFVGLSQLGLAGLALSGLVSIAAAQLTIGIYTVMLLHLHTEGRVPALGELFKTALPRVLGLIWLAVVVALGVGLGMVFFLVPGIYLATRWSVAAPAMVAHKIGTITALKASWAMTKPHVGSVFVVVLFQGMIVLGTGFVAGRLAGDPPALEDLIIVQAIVAALLTPLTGLALAELFLRLSDFRMVTDDPAPIPSGPYVPTPTPYAPGAPAASPYAQGAPAPQQYAAHQPPPAPYFVPGIPGQGEAAAPAIPGGYVPAAPPPAYSAQAPNADHWAQQQAYAPAPDAPPPVPQAQQMPREDLQPLATPQLPPRDAPQTQRTDSVPPPGFS